MIFILKNNVISFKTDELNKMISIDINNQQWSYIPIAVMRKQ